MNEDTNHNNEPEEDSQGHTADATPQEQTQQQAPGTGEQQTYAPRAEPQQASPPQYTYQAQQGPPDQGYGAPPPGSPYGVPRQQTDRKKYWWLAAGLGIGCLGWAVLGFLILFGIGLAAGGGAGRPTGDHVALIHVNGIITAGKSSSGPFSSSTSGSEDLVALLEEVRNEANAKAVVIRINSPGGSPSGSEEVYSAIQRVRNDGIPVYISMGDVAASGGYYVASAADKIYADASTITGSIGVIFETADMSELYSKIGLKPEVVKSGKFKDIGSPARPITPAERALLQGIVNDTYEQFVQAVAKGRKLKVADVKAIADGRVFTGNQALKLKLIDNIGGLHETVREAAKAGGIAGEPEVEEYGAKGILDTILGGNTESTYSGAEKAVSRKLLEGLLSREASPNGLR